MAITPEQAKAELARRELVRRGVPVEKSQEIAQSIPDAIKEALSSSTKTISDMATLQNEGPINMAKALPPLTGAVGAVLPIPGGATMGTVGGRQISNLALKSIGQDEEIPSTSSQVLEGGLSALGDVTAIPALKKASAGKAIGAAEKAAGVVTRAPLKLPTSGNVGTALDELETMLNSGAPIGPQSARDAYAVANYITGNPAIVGKSNEIAVQAARVRALAQRALNTSIPGRAAPAAAMASAMTIPNKISSGFQAIPKPIKTLVGLAGAGTLADALARRIAR